jgi:hypothetical protein
MAKERAHEKFQRTKSMLDDFCKTHGGAPLRDFKI